MLPISEIVLRMFLEIRAHSRFTNPNDPVFASRNGTPVNENNMAKRILKPIGTALDMPWLSWHVFRHTHSTLTKTLEMHVNDRMALMGYASAEMTDRYTHEDLERMRAGVETISNRIWKPRKQSTSSTSRAFATRKRRILGTSGQREPIRSSKESDSTTEALLAEQKVRGSNPLGRTNPPTKSRA